MCNWSPRRLPPDFLTYYDELLGTWKRRLGNRHDAEDIAHETVLRMLEADAASVLKPRAYLHQTARNLVTDEYRRRARHEIVSLDDLQDGLDELAVPDRVPDSAVYVSEILSAVETALAELPLKCQQVFVWQCIGAMSQGEIAARLDISKNMVEKYRIRALRHLRTRMADFDSQGSDSPRSRRPPRNEP